jgi:hypothetical protein
VRIPRALFLLFQAASIFRASSSHSSSHFASASFRSLASPSESGTRTARCFPFGPIRVAVSPGEPCQDILQVLLCRESAQHTGSYSRIQPDAAESQVLSTDGQACPPGPACADGLLAAPPFHMLASGPHGGAGRSSLLIDAIRKAIRAKTYQ